MRAALKGEPVTYGEMTDTELTEALQKCGPASTSAEAEILKIAVEQVLRLEYGKGELYRAVLPVMQADIEQLQRSLADLSEQVGTLTYRLADNERATQYNRDDLRALKLRLSG